MLWTAFGRRSTEISPGTIVIQDEVKTVRMEVSVEKNSV
jgi:hypothetical protein